MSVVVGYRRVSSTDQRLDRQDLGAVDEMYEEKVSAKDRERPSLAAALAYCRKGDTFRVYSVDRLARSLSDLIAITTELTAKGVRVEAIKDGLVLDPNDPDPQSEFRLHLWGAMAQYERAIIRSRQEEGIALAKERGVYTGRKPALSATEVRRARERRDLGVPVARLARDHGVAKSTMVAALAGSGPYAGQEYAATA
jgi:DNA invertase Pin-like site-specific DNA recombinase